MGEVSHDQIFRQIHELKTELLREINRVATLTRLSDLSQDAGEMRAGRTIYGEGDPELGEFTGGFFGYPGLTIDGVEYFLTGMDNGVLQVGLSLEDGTIYAGKGAVWLDADGLNFVLDSDSTPNMIKWWHESTRSFEIFAYRAVAANTVRSHINSFGNVDEQGSYISIYSFNYGYTKAPSIFIHAPAPGAGNSIVRLTADEINVLGALNVPNDSISYAEIQNVTATDKSLGRVSAGAGDIEEVDFSDLAQTLQGNTTAIAMRGTLGLAEEMTQGVLPTALYNNTAMSFTPLNVAGKLLVFGRTSSTIAGQSLFDGLFRVTSGVFMISFHSGTLTVNTTGALTGTTGTVGKFTVSVHTDGKIYFENRTGETLSLYYAVM